MSVCADPAKAAAEAAVLAAFAATTIWSVSDEGRLELHDEDGVLLAAFVPAPAG
jgi:hypothetical protein